MKNVVLLITGTLILTGCSSQQWQETSSGIIVNLKGKKGRDVKKIKLDVMSENIIHVVASTESEFSKDKSLIVADNRDLSIAGLRVQGKIKRSLSAWKLRLV